MNSRRLTRRVTTLVAGPLVAGGIGLAGVVVGSPATAAAQPAAGGQCTTMPMTSGQGPSTPNTLTRAGQITAAAGPGASDGARTLGVTLTLRPPADRSRVFAVTPADLIGRAHGVNSLRALRAPGAMAWYESPQVGLSCVNS